MATLTLADKIAEAEAAYHSLVTGTSARIVVDQNGERVEFTAANRSALYQYIQQLKAQLPGALPAGSLPMQFTF